MLTDVYDPEQMAMMGALGISIPVPRYGFCCQVCRGERGRETIKTPLLANNKAKSNAR